MTLVLKGDAFISHNSIFINGTCLKCNAQFTWLCIASITTSFDVTNQQVCFPHDNHLLPRTRWLNLTCFRYQSRGLYNRGTTETEPFSEEPYLFRATGYNPLTPHPYTISRTHKPNRFFKCGDRKIMTKVEKSSYFLSINSHAAYCEHLRPSEVSVNPLSSNDL
jgi:hypothetical protein